ncbi:MAG: hypothetical protein ABIR55_07035 [Burkholderiaceae bacterium]
MHKKAFNVDHVTAVTDVAMPALLRAYLHLQPRRHAWRMRGISIALRLHVEQILTGHSHAAHRDTRALQPVGGCQDQDVLRSTGDENERGRLSLCIAKH